MFFTDFADIGGFQKAVCFKDLSILIVRVLNQGHSLQKWLSGSHDVWSYHCWWWCSWSAVEFGDHSFQVKMLYVSGCKNKTCAQSLNNSQTSFFQVQIKMLLWSILNRAVIMQMQKRFALTKRSSWNTMRHQNVFIDLSKPWYENNKQHKCFEH